MRINPAGIPAWFEGKRHISSFDGAYDSEFCFPPRDKLNISSDMINFSKVYAAAREACSLASEPVRISNIAERVSDGSYYIDSETIASSILGELYC